MNLQPEILLHPNIPKPLHGIAPRVIKGDDWWNSVRQTAYSKNDYHCWACGIHKNENKYHRWLEAHEIYEIDYCVGEVKFIDICALCHSCHNFIHSGRLWSIFLKNEVSKEKIEDILIHGFEVLKKNNLKMNSFALTVAKRINLSIFEKYIKYGFHRYGISLVGWNDWCMLIDGVKYKGKFKDFDEWNEFYSKN